jgi:hypothetical protein
VEGAACDELVVAEVAAFCEGGVSVGCGCPRGLRVEMLGVLGGVSGAKAGGLYVRTTLWQAY